MEKLFTPDFRTVLMVAASLITVLLPPTSGSSFQLRISKPVRPTDNRRTRSPRRPLTPEVAVRGGSRLFVGKAIDRGVASILKYARVV
jgi:hypothetical protein